MSKQLILSLFFLLTFAFAVGHEGHKHTEKQVRTQENVHFSEESSFEQFEGRPKTWLQWIGSFHLIFLHFPLALIVMTATSELLNTWFDSPIFDYSARFMLIAASILAIPTALLGFIYSYTASYSGSLADLIWWHMWAGITTAIFAITTTLIREYYSKSKLYYSLLVVLFVLVTVTGFLGGSVTFGPYHMYTPL